MLWFPRLGGRWRDLGRHARLGPVVHPRVGAETNFFRRKALDQCELWKFVSLCPRHTPPSKILESKKGGNGENYLVFSRRGLSLPGRKVLRYRSNPQASSCVTVPRH